MSADDLRNMITNGKHRMPNFSGKLSAEEIDTLVSQIKSAGGNKLFLLSLGIGSLGGQDERRRRINHVLVLIPQERPSLF